MIPFKKITTGEETAINNFVSKATNNILPESITQFYKQEDTYYAIVENRIVFRRQAEHTYYYTMPFGSGQLRYVLMQILENATIMGCKCIIVNITEENKDDIERAMPQHFNFITDDSGIMNAEAKKSFSNSLFNNNESMVPAW